MGSAEKVFAEGLIWMCIGFGCACERVLVAYYIVPYINRFREKLSIGEVMGSVYGKPGQVIIGAAGAFVQLGIVGLQVSSIGYFLHYFLGMPHLWGVLVGSGIVIVYSSVGGIRSVTATDIIQFAALIIIVPLLAFTVLENVGWSKGVCAKVPVSHFDFFAHKDIWKCLTFFILFSIPSLSPAIAQRLLMAKSAEQACHALKTVAILQFVLTLLIALIGLGAAAIKPDLDPRLAFPYLIDKVLSVGFKGIGIAGLVAIIMSSADSFLHSAAVSLVHDVVQPLLRYPLSGDKELKWTQITTLLMGFGAAWVAISFQNIFSLWFAAMNFWKPIVAVPLIAGLVGYYSSIRSFGIATATGLATVLIWPLSLGQYIPINAAIPAVLANLAVFALARQFDTSKNIYYDPDDIMAPLAKAKKEQEEKLRAEGKLPAFSLANWLLQRVKAAAGSF